MPLPRPAPIAVAHRTPYRADATAPITKVRLPPDPGRDEITMTAAQKPEAVRERAAQPSTVHLGMPDFRRDAGRSCTEPEH
ncbi:hypothetical protein GCM10018790_64530 [Kitasatospora xanthocidica]|nr:hypothetical protein GCM10018790_64530 [Kitasatospora xanthocidica]